MKNLQSEEFELFPFFEMTPDLVCIAGKDGFFRKVNDAVVTKLKYTREELFSRPIASFIHPEDKSMTGRKRKKLLAGQPLVNFENRYISKDGEVIWLHWTSLYFPDKEVVFAIAKDITEKKQVEKDVEEKYKKFKSLATHFKSSIERDRKYFAVELHEELAQLAAVVKMDINWISDNLTGLSGAVKSRMEHASGMAELLMKSIRRISFSVSPDMLDDIGFNETLKWLCNEFAVLNGIPCYFESSCDETNLSREVQLDFFRICQEALTNVMLHAQAKNVKITVEECNRGVCLCVIDDGKGFDIKQQKKLSGLTSISERAASINGQVNIASEIGKGTKICLIIAQQADEID